MDGFEQEDRRSTKLVQIVIIVVCLIIIIASIFSLIFVKHEQRKFTNLINDTDIKIAEVKDNIYYQGNTIVGIKKEIEDNSHIEKMLKEQKELFPTLASKLEEEIKSNKVDAKIAYLTFDDGPYLITNKFLDILDLYNVRATFFYLQKTEEYGYEEDTVKVYDEVYKRIINSGHTLGNHTASHNLKKKNNGIYNSTDNFMSDIIKNRDFIYDNYGYKTTLIRFPGGSTTAGDLKDDIVSELRKENYGYVEWNSETGDGKSFISVEQSVDNVLSTTNDRDFLVVLMHDYSENTLKALPDIIEGLRKQGYLLLPLFYDSIMVNK